MSYTIFCTVGFRNPSSVDAPINPLNQNTTWQDVIKVVICGRARATRAPERTQSRQCSSPSRTPRTAFDSKRTDPGVSISIKCLVKYGNVTNVLETRALCCVSEVCTDRCPRGTNEGRSLACCTSVGRQGGPGLIEINYGPAVSRCARKPLGHTILGMPVVIKFKLITGDCRAFAVPVHSLECQRRRCFKMPPRRIKTMAHRPAPKNS